MYDDCCRMIPHLLLKKGGGGGGGVKARLVAITLSTDPCE